jgi:DNA-binding transcriptional MerR regulator
MSIGKFAQCSGLTPSALRFYQDAGLIRPAVVDDASGYRYYAAGQLAQGIAIRQLRDMAMPLGAIPQVLDDDAAEAGRLIDEHVARLGDQLRQARRTAAAFQERPGEGSGLPVASVKGPVLAAAAEQILTAAAPGPGSPVLGGLRVEAASGALTLTATDGYRLATRTLVPDQAPGTTWAATLNGDDLREILPRIRHRALVHVEASRPGVRLRTDCGHTEYCRTVAGQYPDYRLLLSALPPAATRLTVARDALLRALDRHAGNLIRLHVTRGGLTLGPAPEVAAPRSLRARSAGPPAAAWFHLTTFYPAVSAAIGPDLMLDLRGPGQPATIRSADTGDLTTLAMPARPGVSLAPAGSGTGSLP